MLSPGPQIAAGWIITCLWTPSPARSLPVRPLAHVLMGAGDEAALYVAEAADRTRARAEMIEILDQLIEGVTA